MKFWGHLFVVGAVVLSAGTAVGQERPPRENAMHPNHNGHNGHNSHNGHNGRNGHNQNTGRKVRDYSWIFIDAPEPREIKLHDIITVIVDDKSEVTVNSRFNRTKRTNLEAELNEFVRINSWGNLSNAAENEPTIDAESTSRLNSLGQLIDQEGMRFRIAATVVDVLSNGNLVLEARKSIRTNRDVWEYSLTGNVRSIDISSNNTVLSEHIANLQIEKQQRGKVYNSTKRPWGVVLYDFLSPF